MISRIYFNLKNTVFPLNSSWTGVGWRCVCYSDPILTGFVTTKHFFSDPDVTLLGHRFRWATVSNEPSDVGMWEAVCLFFKGHDRDRRSHVSALYFDSVMSEWVGVTALVFYSILMFYLCEISWLHTSHQPPLSRKCPAHAEQMASTINRLQEFWKCLIFHRSVLGGCFCCCCCCCCFFSFCVIHHDKHSCLPKEISIGIFFHCKSTHRETKPSRFTEVSGAVVLKNRFGAITFHNWLLKHGEDESHLHVVLLLSCGNISTWILLNMW